MEKAKAAVQDFISRDGKHKTTVDEDIRAPVTEEHIKPHQHDNVTTAVDRSVHVDHHHTTVQPVTHKETLPTQHSHNIMPVEHKTVHHGNERDLKDTLDRDAAKYHDTSTTHHTTHSASTAPVAVGERTHHHVHEHVQPVIQKEVVAPQVVHTTVPVHETHHVQAHHHGTSVLPSKTLEEFKGVGASLEGRAATKVGEFDGQPKPYDRSLQTEQLDGDRHMSNASSHHHREGAAAAAAGAGGLAAAEGLHHHNKHREGEGLTGTSTSRGAEGFTGTSTTRGTEGFSNTREAEGLTSTGTEHSRTGHHHTREGAAAGTTAAAAEGLHDSRREKNYTEGLTSTREGEGLSSTRQTEGLTDTTGTERSYQREGDLRNDTGISEKINNEGAFGGPGVATSATDEKKPSLADKLNPFKDSDGDGKKGIMH